jgi:hypothetical protein
MGEKLLYRTHLVRLPALHEPRPDVVVRVLDVHHPRATVVRVVVDRDRHPAGDALDVRGARLLPVQVSLRVVPREESSLVGQRKGDAIKQ